MWRYKFSCKQNEGMPWVSYILLAKSQDEAVKKLSQLTKYYEEAKLISMEELE